MATTENKQTDDEHLAHETKKLGKTSFSAISGVMLSRSSGVVRTIVVNASFGAGATLDAFNAAFRFPNALRDLFADGALSAAFIKSLVEERAKGEAQERKLISITLGFFFIVTLSLAFLLALFSYSFMGLIADQKFKSPDELLLSSQLFKILAFYLPFTMLNAVAMAILNVLGRTFRAMNGSVFLSVGMILGSILLGPAFGYFHINPIFGLAFGSMLGIVFQMVYQFKPLIPLGLLPFPNFHFRDWLSYKPLHEMLRLMAPRALGQGALTIALMINTFFAIQVGQGVLTYIVTAILIIQVPIGLFGVASGFAAQPLLTKAVHEGASRKFSKLLVESLNSSMWLALLTTGAFALLIVPFYNVIFQHGKITYVDTIQNSVAVCAYATGILFSAGSKVLLNAFYAMNITKQTVYNAITYLVISATLSSLLAPRFGMVGLGISYGISTMCDFFINLFFLKRIGIKHYFSESPYKQGGPFFSVRILLFSVFSFLLPSLGLVAIYSFWKKFDVYFHTQLNFFHSLGVLAIAGPAYFVACILLLYFYGTENLRGLLLKIKGRFVK